MFGDAFIVDRPIVSAVARVCSVVVHHVIMLSSYRVIMFAPWARSPTGVFVDVS